MDSYVITGKLHDDEWFCSIFKHEKLMNSTRPGLAFHDNRLKKKREEWETAQRANSVEYARGKSNSSQTNKSKGVKEKKE